RASRAIRVAMPVLVTPGRDPGPILTRREKTYSVQYRRIGMAPPPSGRALRFRRETSDMLRAAGATFAPPTTKNHPPGREHQCRGTWSAAAKPFPATA